MAVCRRGLREARLQDVEVRVVRAGDAERLAASVAKGVTGSVEQDRVAADLWPRSENAGASVLFHVHRVRSERLIRVVRIGIGDLGLALAADPDLQEVAERPVAALTADDGLYVALVDVMFAGQDRRRRERRGRAAVQRLDHV